MPPPNLPNMVGRDSLRLAPPTQPPHMVGRDSLRRRPHLTSPHGGEGVAASSGPHLTSPTWWGGIRCVGAPIWPPRAAGRDTSGRFLVADRGALGRRVFARVRVHVPDLRPAGFEVALVLGGVFLGDLTGAARLRQHLVIRRRGAAAVRILEELALGELGALGAVDAMPQYVGAAGVGIMDERKEALARQSRTALGLAVVLELEKPAHDLLLASFLHVVYNAWGRALPLGLRVCPTHPRATSPRRHRRHHRSRPPSRPRATRLLRRDTRLLRRGTRRPRRATSRRACPWQQPPAEASASCSSSAERQPGRSASESSASSCRSSPTSTSRCFRSSGSSTPSRRSSQAPWPGGSAASSF